MPRPGVPYNPEDPERERTFLVQMPTSSLSPDLSGGVQLADREGVFAQSFKCRECTLHFVLFSWSETRHHPGTIACPECGNRESFMHRRTRLSSSTGFRIDPDREPEIYDVWPFRLGSVPIRTTSSGTPTPGIGGQAPTTGGQPVGDRDDAAEAEKAADARVIAWCDAAPTQRLVVTSKARGPVAWISVEALSPLRAPERIENPRRLLMVSVARMASIVDGRPGGDPTFVYREGIPWDDFDAVRGDGYRWYEDRFDPSRVIVPNPIPEAAVAWWEAHRGLLSVRCKMHGQIARIDASRSPYILGPAWDAAVVENHARWESSWKGSWDEPDFEGADCWAVITSETVPDGTGLFDVMPMWKSLEGRWPWWPYGLGP